MRTAHILTETDTDEHPHTLRAYTSTRIHTCANTHMHAHTDTDTDTDTQGHDVVLSSAQDMECAICQLVQLATSNYPHLHVTTIGKSYNPKPQNNTAVSRHRWRTMLN